MKIYEVVGSWINTNNGYTLGILEAEHPELLISFEEFIDKQTLLKGESQNGNARNRQRKTLVNP